MEENSSISAVVSRSVTRDSSTTSTGLSLGVGMGATMLWKKSVLNSLALVVPGTTSKCFWCASLHRTGTQSEKRLISLKPLRVALCSRAMCDADTMDVIRRLSKSMTICAT
eukprot:CAMPEP_0178442604 /NCGR_PEP_ID=MMETSP0689_2-20121128/38287_1 /TAXON_ID=160604 /ORGANISM="Amphidinium massartii, Strain CS-259" /LENGTH=110 /DNA_ID=CAMNT_0020066229 /DNA_START=40 /DNA_END=372 /DNA_ORIENTATION=+